MRHLRFAVSGLLIGVVLCLQTIVSAAPVVQTIRYSQTAQQMRIVLDMTEAAKYEVTYEPEYSRLVVDVAAEVAPAVDAFMRFNDPQVAAVRTVAGGDGRAKVFVELKTTVDYRAFPLKLPNRLVIDVVRNFEQKISEEVAPGLRYRFWSQSKNGGPVAIHLLDVDPTAGYMLKPSISRKAVPSLGTVGEMCAQTGAIAGINASYFVPTGQVIGLLELDGKIMNAPFLPRTAVGRTKTGEYLIDQVDYRAYVELAGGQAIPVNGLNSERGQDVLIVYNSYRGASTQTNPYGKEYLIRNNKVTAIGAMGNMPIPNDGFVLSAHGTAAQRLVTLKLGDTVQLHESLGEGWDNVTDAIGAGPALVKNGQVFITTKVEEFGSDVAGGRAPRTALGMTKNGHLLLVVVDGRQNHSQGMTLLELAQFMVELGAVEAMNLDGGGSSEMVVQGKIANRPSDGRERPVGSSLLVLKLAN